MYLTGSPDFDSIISMFVDIVVLFGVVQSF